MFESFCYIWLRDARNLANAVYLTRNQPPFAKTVLHRFRSGLGIAPKNENPIKITFLVIFFELTQISFSLSIIYCELTQPSFSLSIIYCELKSLQKWSGLPLGESSTQG